MTEKAFIREVGLRDGIQMVKEIVPTDKKLAWCRASVAAGMTEVEITSFVPAKVVPQFADAQDVAQGVLAMDEAKSGRFVPATLVPNLKGAERAIALGVPKINYVMSVSEEHNMANVRRSVADSVEDFGRIVALRDQEAKGKVRVAAGIATAFGCTISGAVSEKRVLQLTETLLEMGADELIVADTVGYGNPAQARRILGAIVKAAGSVPVAAHFHDTRGLGLANVVGALDAGVRRFDASLGGLGGCPFAPGATGNINTEDCAFLLESMGFDTGLDIEALVAWRREVETWLPGERFSGAMERAGLPKDFRKPVDLLG